MEFQKQLGISVELYNGLLVCGLIYFIKVLQEYIIEHTDVVL